MPALLEWLDQFPPVIQALIGTLFTWAMTALGAAAIFLSRRPSRKMQDGMLGFAAGVMIAASFWSLLSPAIVLSGGSWVPATVGFLLGGIFLRGIDAILPHLPPLRRNTGRPSCPMETQYSAGHRHYAA